jgi:hypothetical protein
VSSNSDVLMEEQDGYAADEQKEMVEGDKAEASLQASCAAWPCVQGNRALAMRQCALPTYLFPTVVMSSVQLPMLECQTHATQVLATSSVSPDSTPVVCPVLFVQGWPARPYPLQAPV